MDGREDHDKGWRAFHDYAVGTKIPSPKSQVPSPKSQVPKTQFGIWDLELGVWDLLALSSDPPDSKPGNHCDRGEKLALGRGVERIAGDLQIQPKARPPALVV